MLVCNEQSELSNGVRVGPLLRNFSKLQPSIQARLVALKRHDYWDQIHFILGRCVHHWRITRVKYPVLEVPVFSGRYRRLCSAMLSYLDTAEVVQMF